MLEVDTEPARVVVPDGASPAERRVMYVATSNTGRVVV